MERKFFSKKVLHIQVMGIFQRPLKRLILICDFLFLKKKTFEVRAPNFRFYFFLRTSDFTFFQGIFFRLFFFSTIVFWTNDYVSETFIVGFFPFDVFCKTLKVRENGLWTLRTKNGPFCTKIWSSIRLGNILIIDSITSVHGKIS